MLRGLLRKTIQLMMNSKFSAETSEILKFEEDFHFMTLNYKFWMIMLRQLMNGEKGSTNKESLRCEKC